MSSVASTRFPPAWSKTGDGLASGHATHRRRCDGPTWRELVPFALAGVLPFALLPFPGPAFDPMLTAVGAVLCCVVLVTCAALVRYQVQHVDVLWLAPTAGYLVAVAILREAGGGNDSGFGPLALVPAVWLGLYASWRALAPTVVGVALVYWLPVVLSGSAEAYPASGWRLGALIACLTAILGGAILDVRRRLELQTEGITALALQDPLTGLPNRRAWQEGLERALRATRRAGWRCAVVLIDVDHFKAVNDRDGHAAGDALLRELASRWNAEIRAGDVLARIGGDEFAAVLPATDAGDAEEIAHRMHALAAPARCSLGIATWDGHETPEELLARADAALYEAKASGRDRIVAARDGRRLEVAAG
jgi:diguanylate cyclase (GGDEF)-like protein